MTIIREKLAESEALALVGSESIIDDIIDFFERKHDHDKIRDGIKQRYGLGIKKVDDPSGAGGAPIEVYTRETFSTQVDAGMIEAISVGWGHKVVAALATLFTERGQRFDLYKDGETENLEDESEYIENMRESGGFISALVEADRRSVQVGSCAVMPFFIGGALEYRVFSPSAIRVYFPEVIIEDDVPRKPNYSDIEDAYAIVIRSSKVNAVTNNYIAIFGRSTDHPDGLWIEYQSESSSTALPDVNARDSISYRINGIDCNPLSYYANENPDMPVPDYPISVIKGPTSDSSTPFPTYTSLYDDAKEFEVAASHSLSCSQDAARGVTILQVSEVGSTEPLPETLSGAIVARPGQEVKHENKSGSDAKLSVESLDMLSVSAAAGWSVPDYMVASEDHALAASSGIALDVKTRPLKKERERREKQNSPSVSKLFNIEKSLLDLFDDEKADMAKRLTECNMSWSSGPIELPENKKEKAERVISLLDNGVFDTIAAIRDYHGLSTDAEAKQYYKTMKDRATEYPPINVTDKKPQVRPVGVNRVKQGV